MNTETASRKIANALVNDLSNYLTSVMDDVFVDLIESNDMLGGHGKDVWESMHPNAVIRNVLENKKLMNAFKRSLNIALVDVLRNYVEDNEGLDDDEWY